MSDENAWAKSPQPVHTVYGGAHLFRADSTAKLGKMALRSLAEYAPDVTSFGEAMFGATSGSSSGLGDGGPLLATVYERVLEKLRRDPVEDFRIDFEDGYGIRADQEEDEHARGAAREVGKGFREGSLPPLLGIRIKPFSDASRLRAERTLRAFFSGLMTETNGRLPLGFVVTLPKVNRPAQSAAMVRVLEALEKEWGIAPGALFFEVMVEDPSALFGPHGARNLPEIVEAAEGRCRGVHFGAYDYTASCQVTSVHQRLGHPICDFARQMMQATLVEAPVWLSDGATNVLPLGVHRSTGADQPLTSEQTSANRTAVHDAWRLHVSDVRHSLDSGFYQGWDLHPAQLPSRYAAVYAFFIEAMPAAAARLRNFIEKAAQATRVGSVFDDAATGQGLLNFFRRGLGSGAFTEAELHRHGLERLTRDILDSRSFASLSV